MVLQSALVPSVTLRTHEGICQPRLVALHTNQRMSRILPLRMGSSFEADAELANTYWATWAEEEGITADGDFLPGEDMIQEELKRMFNLDIDDNRVAAKEGMDELQVRIASCMGTTSTVAGERPS